MKKIIGYCAIFVVCVLINGYASAADDQLYITINYGVAISGNFHYNDGFKVKKPKNAEVFGLVFGSRFNDNIRIELASNMFNNFEYKDVEIDNVADHYYRQKVNATAAFANVYYDVRKFEKFVPYANIGVGYSRNKARNMELHFVQANKTADATVYQGKSKDRFAWNVGAGISYEVNKRFVLDLISYKYYELGKFSTKRDEVGDVLKDKLKIHSITTGIKINF
jgi:opacity protein-like surface antigen